MTGRQEWLTVCLRHCGHRALWWKEKPTVNCRDHNKGHRGGLKWDLQCSPNHPRVFREQCVKSKSGTSTLGGRAWRRKLDHCGLAPLEKISSCLLSPYAAIAIWHNTHNIWGKAVDTGLLRKMLRQKANKELSLHKNHKERTPGDVEASVNLDPRLGDHSFVLLLFFLWEETRPTIAAGPGKSRKSLSVATQAGKNWHPEATDLEGANLLLAQSTLSYSSFTPDNEKHKCGIMKITF